MALFEATFKILLRQDLLAPDLTSALKEAEKIAQMIYHREPEFIFIDVAKIEEKVV